jgi:hypothetical protein
LVCCTAGIFFTKDGDAEGQLLRPKLYGATRESPVLRNVTRLALFLLQLTHVTAKLACVALLFRTSYNALAAYLLGGMSLYLGYKLARRDFHYFLPGSGKLIALVARMIAKLLVDFTGNPHFRNPYVPRAAVRAVEPIAVPRTHHLRYELGGLVWLLTLLETQCAFGVSCFLYSRFYDGSSKLADGPLFVGLCAITSAWAAALATFVLSLRPSHLRSFVSVETGRQWSQRVFHEFAGHDECRIEIFRDSVHLWRPILPAVRDWVRDNYDDWSGPPAQTWFTAEVRGTIPLDLLPTVSIVRPAAAATGATVSQPVPTATRPQHLLDLDFPESESPQEPAEPHAASVGRHDEVVASGVCQ